MFASQLPRGSVRLGRVYDGALTRWEKTERGWVNQETGDTTHSFYGPQWLTQGTTRGCLCLVPESFEEAQAAAETEARWAQITLESRQIGRHVEAQAHQDRAAALRLWATELVETQRQERAAAKAAEGKAA